ncbi:MAG: hypothetical protein GX640_21290, partial [Fibrobacter sp.]|nr:hypothetical protein [Fibrobacter sp.]
ATSISIELYTLLEQNKIAAAKDRFNRERSFLAKYMWKDAYDMLETTLNQTSSTSGGNSIYAISASDVTPGIDNTQQVNQEKAQQEIMQLYSMLENNQIKAAYDRFTKARTNLQKYLDKEVYDMLETTVVQARNAASW